MSPVSIKLLHMRAPFKRRGRREWGRERRTGDGGAGEWDHLWMLRRMLGQPILCPDNYQVPAELVGCWNLKKKRKKKESKKRKEKLHPIKHGLKTFPRLGTCEGKDKCAIRLERSQKWADVLLEIMRNKWSGLCHWHTFTHTHKHAHTVTWQHTRPPRFN